jgi:hypothetical protein
MMAEDCGIIVKIFEMVQKCCFATSNVSLYADCKWVVVKFS